MPPASHNRAKAKSSPSARDGPSSSALPQSGASEFDWERDAAKHLIPRVGQRLTRPTRSLPAWSKPAKKKALQALPRFPRDGRASVIAWTGSGISRKLSLWTHLLRAGGGLDQILEFELERQRRRRERAP